MLRQVTAVRAHRAVTILGALLAASALLLLSLLPSPPSESVAIVTWVERGRSLLSWADELLFFGVICWGAGIRGLFAANGRASTRINLGVTALATALIALVGVLLAVGRLIYPVFGIQLSAESHALLVSTTFGVLHLAFLGFAVAAATLTWSTSAGLVGRAVGIIAATAFVGGSFPWLTPSWWNSAVAVLVAAWGVFLGVATTTPSKDRGDTATSP